MNLMNVLFSFNISKYFTKINVMFNFCARKYDYIVHINFDEMKKFAKQSIYLTLHVCRKVFVIYDVYVEIFLFFVYDNNKFVSIIKMHSSLIKKDWTIDDWYVFAISYRDYDICLKWQWICVKLRYNIEISYVYNYAFFLFIVNDFLNAKTKIRKRRWLINSKHSICTMQIVENFVHQIFVLCIQWIYFCFFWHTILLIIFQEYFHSIFFDILTKSMFCQNVENSSTILTNESMSSKL